MRHDFEWVSGGEYARESAKATGLHNSSENCSSAKKPHALPKIWFRADACDMRISLPHSSTFIPLRFILWISTQPQNTLRLCPVKALGKTEKQLALLLSNDSMKMCCLVYFGSSSFLKPQSIS